MSEVKDIDWFTLAAVGIVGGLICIYAAVVLNAVFKVNYFAFVAAAGAILATVWGADAVRRICKYGIGTGVPSIGMLAFGMGLLSTLLGLKVADYLIGQGTLTTTLVTGVPIALVLGPIIALILSLVQGAVVGYLAQNILKMKIPTMQMGMIFIAGAASIIYIGYFTLITGTFAYPTVISSILGTGFIAPVFMIGALPMLHPYNACLGPDEEQKRTLTLAVESSLMTTVIFGILSLAIFAVAPANDIITPAITVVLGLIAWIIAYFAYWARVKESGTIILETGVLPKKEA